MVLASASLMIAFSLSSCVPRAGTDVGNGFTSKLNMQGYQRPAVSALSVQLGSGVSVDGFWVTSANYQFQSGSDCATATGPVAFAGPVVADLIGAGFLGGPREIHTSGAPTCALEWSLSTLDATSLPSGAPAELAGSSVLLRGRRSDGVAFVVRSTSTSAIRIDADGGGTFALGSAAPIVGIDLEQVVNSLQLDSLSDNPIIIDDTHNADHLRDFESAIRDSSTLFGDNDNDGLLNPTEATSSNELGHGGP